MNVTEQIADIRERLMHVETILSEMQRQQTLQNTVPKKEGVYIPMAIMVMVGQGAFALVQHFF